MTKSVMKRELRNIQSELDWLLWCERKNNPDWQFCIFRRDEATCTEK